MYGSYAKPIDPNRRGPNINPDHTHEWTVFVRPVPTSAPAEHLTYWLKKVQFKLHETYAQSTRTIEAPPFEVTETGWGEFEVQLKLYFVPEANEKAQTLWHPLKLHPFGEDVEGKRERREPVLSQNYDEVVFSEPVEAFYDILTSSGAPSRGSKGGAGGGGKQIQGRNKQQIERTAEIPDLPAKDNIYSKHEEEKEIVRLKDATKKVEILVKEERKKLAETEKAMDELKKEQANGTATA